MSTAPSPKVTPPAQGAKITISNGKLSVPANPIIPFIEGDGTGADIWRASVRAAARWTSPPPRTRACSRRRPPPAPTRCGPG